MTTKSSGGNNNIGTRTGRPAWLWLISTPDTPVLKKLSGTGPCPVQCARRIASRGPPRTLPFLSWFY